LADKKYAGKLTVCIKELTWASDIYDLKSDLLPTIAINTSLSVLAFTYCSQNYYIY
jgi:hypothetical protein